MAIQHGKPAYGAAEEIVRLKTGGFTPRGSSWKALLAMVCTAIIGFFAGIRAIEVFTDGIIGIVLWVVLIVALWKFTPRVGSFVKAHTVTSNPANTQFYADIDHTYRALQKMAAGNRAITMDAFPDDQATWAIGGAQEIRVSKKLTQAFDDTYTVIDDITLHKNGNISANIDHLLLGPTCALMIDTKVWKQPLKFSTHPVYGGKYLKKGSPYWTAVATCVYEASFLPKEPGAIIFVVAGGAGKALAKSGPQCVSHYVPKYGDISDVKHTPCPVYFCATKDIEKTVHTVEEKLDPSRTGPITIQQINRSRNITY